MLRNSKHISLVPLNTSLHVVNARPTEINKARHHFPDDFLNAGAREELQAQGPFVAGQEEGDRQAQDPRGKKDPPGKKTPAGKMPVGKTPVGKTPADKNTAVKKAAK